MICLLNNINRKLDNPWIYGIIVSTLILFGTHNGLFSVFALFVSFLYILFVGGSKELVFLTFLFPYASIFKYVAGSGSFYTYLILICVVKFLLQGLKISKGMYFFISLVVIEQLVFFDVNVPRTIKLCGGLIFVLYGLNKLNEKQSEDCFIAFVVSFFLSSFYPLLDSDFFHIKEYVQMTALEGTFGINQIFRFSGLWQDPNYYSVNLMVALTLIVVLFYKERVNFFTLIAVFALSGYFTVLTYSKSSFLMFAYPIILLIGTCITKKKMGALFIVSVLVFASIIYICLGKADFLDIVFNRLSNSSESGDLTTGRWDIWLNYFRFFDENIILFFIGSGISANYVNNAAAHNTYIEFVYSCGLLGLLLFLFAIKEMFQKNCLLKFPRNYMNLSVVICLVIMYFFLSELFAYDFTWHLLLSGLVFKMNLSNGVTNDV